jgi:hypothetical protein
MATPNDLFPERTDTRSDVVAAATFLGGSEMIEHRLAVAVPRSPFPAADCGSKTGAAAEVRPRRPFLRVRVWIPY